MCQFSSFLGALQLQCCHYSHSTFKKSFLWMSPLALRQVVLVAWSYFCFSFVSCAIFILFFIFCVVFFFKKVQMLDGFPILDILGDWTIHCRTHRERHSGSPNHHSSSILYGYPTLYMNYIIPPRMMQGPKHYRMNYSIAAHSCDLWLTSPSIPILISYGYCGRHQLNAKWYES